MVNNTAKLKIRPYTGEAYDVEIPIPDYIYYEKGMWMHGLTTISSMLNGTKSFASQHIVRKVKEARL